MDKIRFVLSNIGMELPLCLYMMTSYLKYPVFQNLIFEKVCLRRYDNMALCTNVSAYYDDRNIQTDANHFYSISSYTLMGPSLISTLLLGAASDFWSVKVPLLIPFFGLILCSFNYIVQTALMGSNVYLLLISDAIFGVCGGYISIISTTMSYGVKTTGAGGRSYRIATMEGAIGLGGTIGYAVSGSVRQALGYSYTFLLIMVLQCIAFFYILILAKDISPIATVSDSTESPSFLTKVYRRVLLIFSDFYELLTMRRGTRIYIFVNLLALGVELLIFAGLSDIQYSYLRYKLAWDDKQYGWFSGLSFGITTAAVLTLYPLLRSRGISDGLLGCLGMIFKIISLFMFAFLVNPAMAYSITVVTMFNRFVSSGFRSFLSALITTEEQGKMFSLVALLEGVTSLLATAIYNNVYPKTLSFFPGLMYVVSALILLPSLITLGVSDIHVRKRGLVHSSLPPPTMSAPSPNTSTESL